MREVSIEPSQGPSDTLVAVNGVGFGFSHD